MSGSYSPIPGEDRWLLPDGVEELLPESAARVERMRRDMLDLYARWGYELVIPPLIEFTESLLIGLGEDLDLQTFKLTDQITGRQLGIRPDMTPQAARMDAHSLRRDGPVRLCYSGSVLHTRPRSPFASRSPIQIGAEFYGDASIEADIEIICLMLETLNRAGVANLTLDLGHVGIFDGLVADLRLPGPIQMALFDALQDKSAAAIDEILKSSELDAGHATIIAQLAGLNGDAAVLDRADRLFAGTGERIAAAIAMLRRVAAAIGVRMPQVSLHFDLCELHGYHYHTGLVFAAYVPGHGGAVANGGRYDDIGRVFGRARPATGFNMDLKTLLHLGATPDTATDARCVFAAHETVDAGWAEIQRLRDAGECVIVGLPEQAFDPRCNRELRRDANGWQTVLLKKGASDGK